MVLIVSTRRPPCHKNRRHQSNHATSRIIQSHVSSHFAVARSGTLPLDGAPSMDLERRNSMEATE